jgi:N-acetylglucosamine-6-sulfatase
VRDGAELSAEQVREIDETHRQRLRSLLAVDEMIADTVEALGAAGVLENTYLLLTSDNGLLAGEHRLAAGKQAPYEEAIRVPLLVRGPGVAAGQTAPALALNVDLAPTIVELAGARAPDFVDGRSLAPLLRGESPAARRRAFLVELFAPVKAQEAGTAAGEPGEGGGEESAVPPYRALRTADELYVEHETGERELYDLRADPYQLENQAATVGPARLERMAARLAELRDCAGVDCQAAENAVIEPASG